MKKRIGLLLEVDEYDKFRKQAKESGINTMSAYARHCMVQDGIRRENVATVKNIIKSEEE